MEQYIGKMLDNRYEILDIIGVGGMAVVYKAYCHRLNRFVAIKVLKRDLASAEEFRRRFHEEAQAVAKLSHPNIVSVYDVSRGDDLDYIVMELIDGITLKQYIQQKDGSLNWREALYFTNQIVRALGHAHSRGIIHRDIKPQNIMVLRDGSVKVADFGIARIISAAQTTLTQEALGSVHYISPEQARGSHIDTRADIYSAGVVLYEMLTGRLPFDGDTPVAIAIQHINSKPLAPRELNPEIPPGLEEITMKAMSPRIDRRYRNAEEMLQDLEEFRKNPQTVFHYDLSSFHGSQPVPEEAVQNRDSVDSLGRRRGRPPAPPRYQEEELDEEEYDEEEEEPRRRGLIIPIVAIVFLVGAAVVLWLTYFSGFFSGADKLEVPNLQGRTLTELYEDAALMESFKINRVSTEFSEEFREGEIISQKPDPGEMAEKGSAINVVVSGGQESIEMIDVLDMSYEKAVTQLGNVGLGLDEPGYEYSEEVSEGNVITSIPAAGERIMPGEMVHLVISLGPETPMVTMPSVVGQSLESARTVLTGMGLTVGGVTEVYSARPVNQVLEQSITATTEVEAGTAVTLQVSKGPEPSTTTTQEEEDPLQPTQPVIPTVKRVKVPQVEGLNMEEARNRLFQVGLQVSVSPVESDEPVGQVIYQSVQENETVEEGTSIVLQVSAGRQTQQEEETPTPSPATPASPTTPSSPTTPTNPTTPTTPTTPTNPTTPTTPSEQEEAGPEL